MAKVEITLTANYVKSWGTWEGIRELVQNARDGETEHGAAMSIKHTDAGNLVIKNRGVTLPREALLIGFTTKENNERMIGQFGEGLKLGILALCRKGFKIRINNGPEIWKPSIERSEKYDAEVLCFDITKSKAREISEDLVVTVEGVPHEYWESIRTRFLFLNPEVKVIDCGYHGSLIIDDKMRGMLFVKGIFVEQTEAQHGYDFQNVSTDRDRRMINAWDKKYNMSRILAAATEKKHILQSAISDRIWNLLEKGSEEVGLMDSAVLYNTDLQDVLVQKFYDKYGRDSFPVADMDESRQLEALGKQGVVVPDMLRNVLSRKMGGFHDQMLALSKEEVKSYSWHDLTEQEKKNILLVQQLLVDTDEREVSANVVDFNDPNCFGQCKDGKVYIARSILLDLPGFLHVYVHEWAHIGGAGDVDISHARMVGHKLAEIAVNLLNVKEAV